MLRNILISSLLLVVIKSAPANRMPDNTEIIQDPIVNFIKADLNGLDKGLVLNNIYEHFMEAQSAMGKSYMVYKRGVSGSEREAEIKTLIEDMQNEIANVLVEIIQDSLARSKMELAMKNNGFSM